MSEDQFTRLFSYMTQRFDRLEAELAKKADLARVERALDVILGRLDDHDIELAAINNRLDRLTHETEQLSRQVGQLAYHTGVRLSADP